MKKVMDLDAAEIGVDISSVHGETFFAPPESINRPGNTAVHTRTEGEYHVPFPRGERIETVVKNCS